MSSIEKLFLVCVSVVLVLCVVAVTFGTGDENVYCSYGEVIATELTPYGDVEVAVVDDNGSIWSYYSDEEVQVGNVVVLTFFNYGTEEQEDDEIIDAAVVEVR